MMDEGIANDREIETEEKKVMEEEGSSKWQGECIRHDVSYTAFAGTKLNEIFTATQQRHVAVKIRRFSRYHFPDYEDRDGSLNVGFLRLPDAAEKT